MRATLVAAVLPVVIGLVAAPPVGAFSSGGLRQGESWTQSWEVPGVYEYHCAPHPWMKGVVLVDAAASHENATLNVTIQGFDYQPRDLTVAPGQAITWTNLDQALHTVTQDEPEEGGPAKWQIVVGLVSLVGVVALMIYLLRRP